MTIHQRGESVNDNGPEYWGYVHQGERGGKYKSAEERLKEMDRQWNKMIVKEVLTIYFLFLYAIVLSVSIVIIIGYLVGG